MTTLFFSATGNSLFVAKTLGGNLTSIPQLEREGIYEIKDDVIGIVSPVYYFTLPLLVKRYLNKVKLEANYIYGVLTYGAQGGAATDQLAKILKDGGNRLDYAADLLMVDNYLPRFKIENELTKLPQKNIDSSLTIIKHDIESRKLGLPKKGFIFRLASQRMNNTIMGSEKGIASKNNTDKSFTVTDECNGCKTCARVCPVSNIKVGVKPEFLHHCESCFACIHNCPQGAIQIDTQKSSARFRNEHVTLKELIEANGD